jgi:hypothetical protein
MNAFVCIRSAPEAVEGVGGFYRANMPNRIPITAPVPMIAQRMILRFRAFPYSL